MKTAINRLVIVGELVALAIVSAIFLALGGGQFWQAAIMVSAAGLWWIYGREIKRKGLRRVLGAATVIVALAGTALVAGCAMTPVSPEQQAAYNAYQASYSACTAMAGALGGSPLAIHARAESCANNPEAAMQAMQSIQQVQLSGRVRVDNY